MTPGKTGNGFVKDIEKRRELHEKHEREGLKSFWNSVGMMGSVGWSIAMPTAAGTLFGRWLDRKLDSAYVFMVFFMLVGLGMGCVVVWRLISERR